MREKNASYEKNKATNDNPTIAPSTAKGSNKNPYPRMEMEGNCKLKYQWEK